MSKRRSTKLKGVSTFMMVIVLLSIIPGASGDVFAQSEEPFVEVVNDYFTVQHYNLEDGTAIERATINGPSEPPVEYQAEIEDSIQPLPSEGVISNFPSYDWVFGCSAVSGAMIAGYYDRNGYPNMYAGPTDGGVMPLTDTSWSTWSDGYKTYPNNPLIASHKNVDGRTTKGSIDDYWVKYDSTANDPYITGGWTQHTWGSAIGDYMKTSQSAWPYLNTDGSSSFWNYTDNTILTCAAMETLKPLGQTYTISQDDATYGRKEFYEARGYTVTECWNQLTYNAAAGGFSLAQLQAEIDAGHPVLINVIGHSMVAYGYSGSTVYIRTTWDNDPSNTYTMVWDSTPEYAGMKLNSVSIVKLQAAAPTTVPTPIAPTGTISVDKPTYKWSKVTSATRYQIELYKGTTKKYTKTIYSPTCNATTCSKKFYVSLVDGSYKWRVRAYIGGVWKKWSVYKYFTVNTTTSGFNTPFTNNAAGWSTISGSWALATGGYYRTNGLYLKSSSIAYDTKFSTMVYEVRMKRVGDLGAANRVIIRGVPYPLSSSKAWDDGYLFQYANGEYVSVWKAVNGVYTALMNWTSYSGVNDGGFNTFKIVANGTSLKFYLNGSLVWSGSDSTFSTGKVGIFMHKGTSGWNPLIVDWAKLTTTVSSMEPDVLAELGETIESCTSENFCIVED